MVASSATSRHLRVLTFTHSHTREGGVTACKIICFSCLSYMLLIHVVTQYCTGPSIQNVHACALGEPHSPVPCAMCHVLERARTPAHAPHTPHTCTYVMRCWALCVGCVHTPHTQGPTSHHVLVHEQARPPHSPPTTHMHITCTRVCPPAPVQNHRRRPPTHHMEGTESSFRLARGRAEAGWGGG